jgi:hypothetical protein
MQTGGRIGGFNVVGMNIEAKLLKEIADRLLVEATEQKLLAISCTLTAEIAAYPICTATLSAPGSSLMSPSTADASKTTDVILDPRDHEQFQKYDHLQQLQAFGRSGSRWSYELEWRSPGRAPAHAIIHARSENAGPNT